MKKILFCASTVSHILNFHLPYIEEFKRLGWEVWVAAGGAIVAGGALSAGDAGASGATGATGVVPGVEHFVALPLKKKLFSPQNLRAVFALRRLIKAQKFDALSLHTTLASAVARAALLFTQARPKVFSTCHGYLFEEGGGPKNLAYLLPEKLLARVTDVLMVMNRADYAIAQKHRLYRGKLYLTSGMGVELSRFAPATAEERGLAREKSGFEQDSFLFVCAAEFSKRKNQELLIRAFAPLCKAHPEARLLFAGNGALLEPCKALAASLGAAENISFLGHITEMRALYAMCNAAVSASHIEGLPFNIMEAMACGLSVAASNVKGHADLLSSGAGVLFEDGNEESARAAMLKLLEVSNGSALPDMHQYSLEAVLPEIMSIYNAR